MEINRRLLAASQALTEPRCLALSPLVAGPVPNLRGCRLCYLRLQALQGAKLAAQAGSALAPLAAAQPAGGKTANPFLGNSHLSEQRA